MFSSLVSALLAVTIVAGSPSPTVYYEIKEQPITYEELIEEATYDCRWRKWSDVDAELLWSLVEIEKKFNVPAELRGMLLAAACMESGYNPLALGDYRKRGKKKIAKAVGILQLWPWFENKKRGYGIDRKDPIQAAGAWMTHIFKQIPKVKKRCGFKNEVRVWKAAWVTAVRAPKDGGRCYERVNHLKVLNRWHKNIKRVRERALKDAKSGEITNQDGDGC